MFKYLMKLLLDEHGTWAAVAVGGGLAVGGAALGAGLGKNKQKTIDPYAQLRGKYQSYLGDRLGKQTPYEYNDAFTLDQPDIEKQVESTISGKLGNMPKLTSDIYDIQGKYYDARKAQMKDRFDTEHTAQKDVYNRLGLASSSPLLNASDDLTRKQGLEYNTLESEISREGIDQEMRALGLSEDITNMYLNQGQHLGGLQRGYQQYSQEMSMADIERMVNEEYNFANLTGNLISGNPPEYYYEPNFWSQFGSGLQSAGTGIMSLGMMDGGGGVAGTGAGTQTFPVGKRPRLGTV